jgi:hypothetical protein
LQSSKIASTPASRNASHFNRPENARQIEAIRRLATGAPTLNIGTRSPAASASTKSAARRPDEINGLARLLAREAAQILKISNQQSKISNQKSQSQSEIEVAPPGARPGKTSISPAKALAIELNRPASVWLKPAETLLKRRWMTEGAIDQLSQAEGAECHLWEAAASMSACPVESLTAQGREMGDRFR